MRLPAILDPFADGAAPAVMARIALDWMIEDPAIDAAFDQSSVDAVHIKLADTSLHGHDPYETFLSIIPVMGNLSLDPQEIN